MLSPELLAAVSRLDLKATHLATDAMIGRYRSAFHGQGMEFSEVRTYVPGDDIRAIDWHVTARMGQPYVKVYREERQMTLVSCVDTSSSMAAGGGPRTKRAVAAEMAAIMTYLAMKGGDRAGLSLFAEKIEHWLPPKSERYHGTQIIKDLLSYSNHNQFCQTNMTSVIDFWCQPRWRRMILILISDFLTLPQDQSLRTLCRRHDVIAVSVTAPWDHHLPSAGLVRWQDAETGGIWDVDTSDARSRARILAALQSRHERVSSLFARLGVPHLQLNTQQPVVQPLKNFLNRLSQRGRH